MKGAANGMGRIKIDPEKCKKEGLCIELCCECHVYSRQSPDEVPAVTDEKECAECGHCVAVCPGNAITHGGMDMSAFAPVDRSAIPGPDAMKNFLFSLRTTRHYVTKPLPEHIIAELIHAGSMAASEHNSQDRQFVVLTNPETIHTLAGKIVAHYRTLLTILSKPLRAALSPLAPAQMAYLERSVSDMKRKVAEYGPQSDPIFHKAPCVIVITSTKGNVLAKDTALTSQEAMRMLAHSHGLGTCISGYAIGAAPVVSKFLKIPNTQKVQTVFTVGYPVYRHNKITPRKAPVVRRID